MSFEEFFQHPWVAARSPPPPGPGDAALSPFAATHGLLSGASSQSGTRSCLPPQHAVCAAERA